jgi:hypothetical protein
MQATCLECAGRGSPRQPAVLASEAWLARLLLATP